MKRLSIFITWMVFVAYFSLLAGGTHETVLCLGENGHIAIEPAQKGDCHTLVPGFDLPPSPSHDPVFSSSAKPQRGHCVDFDLSTMYSYRMTVPGQKKLSPLHQKSPIYSTTQTLFSEIPQRILLSPIQFSKHRSATLLQTTVLLI
jgi:hypothetical protein